MKSSEFAYWLMGYFELHGTQSGMSIEQTECVKRHLDLVFIHHLDPEQIAEKLQEVHDGPKEAVQPAGEPYADAPPIGGGTSCPYVRHPKHWPNCACWKNPTQSSGGPRYRC